jgi:hypothetical protein
MPHKDKIGVSLVFWSLILFPVTPFPAHFTIIHVPLVTLLGVLPQSSPSIKMSTSEIYHEEEFPFSARISTYLTL